MQKPHTLASIAKLAQDGFGREQGECHHRELKVPKCGLQRGIALQLQNPVGRATRALIAILMGHMWSANARICH
ncbi:hypothetical protein [Pseudorhodoferax soli]|uniref:hypothetical protein n=1 Tax=Pseudorhodoferax soli TaxID=545864 RepID=UPI0014727B60|nr:hypothetical protein [Pseudorhodoferax soli]